MQRVVESLPCCSVSKSFYPAAARHVIFKPCCPLPASLIAAFSLPCKWETVLVEVPVNVLQSECGVPPHPDAPVRAGGYLRLATASAQLEASRGGLGLGTSGAACRRVSPLLYPLICFSHRSIKLTSTPAPALPAPSRSIPAGQRTLSSTAPPCLTSPLSVPLPDQPLVSPIIQPAQCQSHHLASALSVPPPSQFHVSPNAQPAPCQSHCPARPAVLTTSSVLTRVKAVCRMATDGHPASELWACS